ncbi:hypothetical protein ABCS02_17855 [Microbacterium sp. X-17]|uniref:hypothetical protein n=1 Tax=Microbacterium sp. X-17 TaxID=3144404 RepID=UPI0031F5257F
MFMYFPASTPKPFCARIVSESARYHWRPTVVVSSDDAAAALREGSGVDIAIWNLMALGEAPGASTSTAFTRLLCSLVEEHTLRLFELELCCIDDLALQLCEAAKPAIAASLATVRSQIQVNVVRAAESEYSNALVPA